MIALDLFAGTGWGVAAKQLAIKEYGVEIMPAAVESRSLAGMDTVYSDVWDGLHDESIVPEHSILIASPPCQTFSVAGKGAGREALSDVLRLIQDGAWSKSGTHLRDSAEAIGLDARTALVISPLAYATRFLPDTIVLEQVPSVLPVWEAAGQALKTLGYSVRTDILYSEQYGVPQVRKRAILIARRKAQAAMPKPTHSRHYSHNFARVDDNLPCPITMKEALGWGIENRPAPTQTGHGAATRQATGHQMIYQRAIAEGNFTFRPPFTESSARRGQDIASLSRSFYPASVNPDISEQARLQGYPTGFEFSGSNQDKTLQIGNAVPPPMAKAILESAIC